MVTKSFEFSNISIHRGKKPRIFQQAFCGSVHTLRHYHVTLHNCLCLLDMLAGQQLADGEHCNRWSAGPEKGRLCTTDCRRQSQSHIATDSQSVSLSWYRTPSEAYDQNLIIYFSFKTVTVLSMWAPSLTRGRVCRLSVSPLCGVFVRIIYNILQNT
jgi:hypothetical protein